MSSNFQSIADWQPPETLPKETPGRYLVLVGDSRKDEPELHVYKVQEISNGYMQLVGGHFAWDMLDNERRILAWAPAPAPPQWLED